MNSRGRLWYLLRPVARPCRPSAKFSSVLSLFLNAQLSSNDTCLNKLVERVVQQYLEDMGSTPPDNLHDVIIREVERSLIQTVLDHVGGNQSRAALILGITRATLRTRIQRYGL